MRYILVVVFVFLNMLVYYITDQNVKQRVDASLYNHLHNLQVQYEVLMSTKSKNSDIIYNSIVNNSKIIDLLSKAGDPDNKNQKALLRDEMQKILSASYKLMKEQGVLQFHFIFPDNTTFLRMHKPSKFDDDLTRVRADIVKINKDHGIIRGFSQGKTTHAFRNIYPIFDRDKKYLGCVDISFPSELLQKELTMISEIYSHFLVNKSIFNVKEWNREDMILKYSPSLENKEYFITMSERHLKMTHEKNLGDRLKPLQGEIDEKMKKGEMFSLLSDHKKGMRILSFLPIYQNTTFEVAAWIVSYEEDDFIESTFSDTIIVRLTAFFIFSIILFFMYRLINQKRKLNVLVDSLNKNVIFSETDKNGTITQVSDAFCKISGYSVKELIGRSHNIVRDPGMEKSVFKNMWDTIKRGKTWKGEIRNKRKDGTFYWIDSEVSPVYEDDKVVGYSSVRHDITDRKDIDSIQREIIFTMGTIGESRSKETGNHVKRVAKYSKILALHWGLGMKEADLLEQASPMHDIGKVAIADSILNKPGRLTPEEREIMETHALKGYEMLEHSTRPLLKTAAIVALEHHEKWDGSGYPKGLKGEEIHIYGRITALADVFDALGSDRCYKKAWDDERIFELFKDERGKHFDPKLIDIFFENIDEFLEVRKKFKDSVV